MAVVPSKVTNPTSREHLCLANPLIGSARSGTSRRKRKTPRLLRQRLVLRVKLWIQRRAKLLSTLVLVQTIKCQVCHIELDMGSGSTATNGQISLEVTRL